MSHWIAARFRDDDVFAECDEAGALKVRSGVVAFRYQRNGKAYKTKAERLAVREGATPEVLGSAEPAAKKKPVRQAMRPLGEAVQLWTDGACTGNPGPAGLGVFMRDGDEERELSEYVGQGTNNIAELAAILRGLELVEDRSRPVDVMTDSAYCVGLLTKNWKPKANQELIAELRKTYATFSDLRIIKVPGHAGVPENEKADQLARDAILERIPSPSRERFERDH